MSEGLYKVVDAITAIGNAAERTAGQIAGAVEAAATGSSMTGGTDGGGMGASSGPGSGSSDSSREGGLVPKWGTTRVIPVGAGDLASQLKALGRR